MIECIFPEWTTNVASWFTQKLVDVDTLSNFIMYLLSKGIYFCQNANMV